VANIRLMEPPGEPVHLRALAFFAVVFGIAAQILYPLVDGDGRMRVYLTIFSVCAFFAAACLHAASESLLALVSVLAICVFLGFVVELIGHKFGLPFGSYTYTSRTWLQIAGVPVVVPLAWAMVGWPAFVAGRLIGQPLIGAPILAAWDLFLDPQMVMDKRWTWAPTSWPKLNGIPISNAIGWLVVGLIMMRLLDYAVNHNIDFEGIPLMVLAWVWFSSIVGHLVFFGKPAVAFTGGLALTLALAPVVLTAMNARPPERNSSSGPPDARRR
jgi:uncharacterized membrane protein